MSLLHLGHDPALLRATLHNGPGRRIALWVQGCRLRCTRRCLNPHLLTPAGGHSIEVAQLLAHLRAACVTEPEPVEGLTVLGGEPSEQPQALAELLAGAHALGLSTMVYTGHSLAELGAPAWLGHCDLLVDGPFDPAREDPALAWRGSRNQRLLCLTDRYDPAALAAAFAAQGKGWSLELRPDGRVSMSGFQGRDEAAEIERLLRGLVSGPGGARPYP